MKKSKLEKLKVGDLVYLKDSKADVYCDPIDLQFQILNVEDVLGAQISVSPLTVGQFHCPDEGWSRVDQKTTLFVPLTDIRTRRPGIKKPKELSTTVVSKYRF